MRNSSRTVVLTASGHAVEPTGSGRPLVGVCEIFVEAGGEQVKRAGEAQPLGGGHGVDVALEPFAPHGACLRGVPAVPFSRAGAACSELDRQFVEEPSEL